MSSAANHRARSRRSHYRHASAANGVRRHVITTSNHHAGGSGAPLIYRLQAFRKWIGSRNAKQAERKGAQET